MNVMELTGGKMGAVNGMTKLGKLETVSLQSEEIWTGVTYGLSSTMIMEVIFYLSKFRIYVVSFLKNLFHEAFVASEGIYDTCYNTAGLAFQTPEALTTNSRFRSVSNLY